MAYERLRTESAKEIAKWKSQVLGDATAFSTDKAGSSDVIKKLKIQCNQLRLQLDTERAEHKKTILRHQRELANIRHLSSSHRPRGASRSVTPTDSRARSGIPPRPSSSGAPLDGPQRRRPSPSAGGHGRPSSSSSRTAARSRDRSSSPLGDASRPAWNAGGSRYALIVLIRRALFFWSDAYFLFFSVFCFPLAERAAGMSRATAQPLPRAPAGPRGRTARPGRARAGGDQMLPVEMTLLPEGGKRIWRHLVSFQTTCM
jgi:hypothetical protein